MTACEWVKVARERHRVRFRDEPRLQPNADMGPSDIRRFCEPDPADKQLLNTTLRQMRLSAWAYHRILKPGRTITGLAGTDATQVSHIAEVIQYRPRRAV